MGNSAACCSSKDGERDQMATATGQELRASDAVPDSGSDGAIFGRAAPGAAAAGAEFHVSEAGSYKVVLDKTKGLKLGLDVDYMAERMVLPVMQVTGGGLAEAWNISNPHVLIKTGDSILDVNGASGKVGAMLERCMADEVLNLTLSRAMTYNHLVGDLERLIAQKTCGPLLIRWSWYDAGVLAQSQGLPDSALSLLAPILMKYCPSLISKADLCALAANVAIRVLGGPAVPTRFGRIETRSAADGVSSQEGVEHLRAIFQQKGIADQEIIALAGAQTVGRRDAKGPLKFDNTYFKEVVSNIETTASGTMMLVSDLALLQDPAFKPHVERYANDQAAWFADFAKAWAKLQGHGIENLLRDVL